MRPEELIFAPRDLDEGEDEREADVAAPGGNDERAEKRVDQQHVVADLHEEERELDLRENQRLVEFHLVEFMRKAQRRHLNICSDLFWNSTWGGRR